MNELTQLDLPLNNIIKKPEDESDDSPSIFFLHGFGSNMQDLFGLVQIFGKDWNCISLQATIQVQYNGWAWADLDFTNIGKLPKPEQMINHQKKVIGSIKKSIDLLNLNPNKINLLGFSQGASLSIYCGLKDFELFNSVVALCGFFPSDQIKGEMNNNAKKLDIFLANGTLDEMVPISLGHATRDGLLSLGVQPDYKEYKCGHTISNDCMRDFLAWLKERNM
tara:strand:- start:2492 stop:3157 length:666 start_codon:yes stop_codon:yes gene_type:complete